jgi:hypothetical protein
MFCPIGDLATRECLLQFCTIASEQVRSNLGVALTLGGHRDPITVISKRISPSFSVWVIIGDVEIRFISTDVAKVVNYLQPNASNGARQTSASDISKVSHANDVR